MLHKTDIRPAFFNAPPFLLCTVVRCPDFCRVVLKNNTDMIQKTLAAWIIVLHIFPLSAQYNWQDTSASPKHSRQVFHNNADSKPLQFSGDRDACGSGMQGHAMLPESSAPELPDAEPPRLLRAYPSTDSLTIEFELEDPAVIRFRMVDAKGKAVLETPYKATRPFRQFETWATGALTPGNYVLMIQIEGRKLAQCPVVVPE